MRSDAMRAAALLLACSAVWGCNTTARIPSIRSAAISPDRLVPDQSALITVDVADRFKIVHEVKGVVKQDTRVKLELKDDGIPPDVKAGDGIWTLDVDVPFQAPPGEFDLELTAYDSTGSVIVVPGPGGADMPLQGVVKMIIDPPPSPTP